MTLYALGKYGGKPLVLKFGKYFLIKDEQLTNADSFFERHGGELPSLEDLYQEFVPLSRGHAE